MSESEQRGTGRSEGEQSQGPNHEEKTEEQARQEEEEKANEQPHSDPPVEGAAGGQASQGV